MLARPLNVSGLKLTFVSLSRDLHKANSLFFVPLGGLGEIGMNLMAVCHQGKAFVIDCGVSFPDNYYPGVDLIMPNIDFFKEFKINIEALVLTHSHEDHLGAVAYLHERMGKPPIYGTKFTHMMLKPRYQEHSKYSEDFCRWIEPKKNWEIMGFEFEALRVTHSLVDCVGLSIKTPFGRIVHTGDFKIDRHPVDKWEFDEERFKELGNEGVKLFMSDSTNVEGEGWSISESELRKSLLELISEVRTGKIFVTLFSSNIHRLQILLEVAEKVNRKVALVGRSVLSNSELAMDAGYLKFNRRNLISASHVERHEPNEVMILCTGTQAEGRSALAKMTSGSHPDIEVRPGDTVIFSSRHIPGNEKRISVLMNNLYRCGARVIDYRDALVHASGHARSEELKEILRWVKPQYFVPVHGETRMLHRHFELAQNTLENLEGQVCENGEIFFLNEEGKLQKHQMKAPAGKVFLDETRNVVPEGTIRERRKLASQGAVCISAVFEKKKFKLREGPHVFSLGLPEEFDLMDLEGSLLELFDDFRNAQQVDIESLEEEIRVNVRRFFRKSLGLKPRVIPIVYVI